MKLSTLRNRVYGIQKGAYTSILWERDAKVKKGCMDCVKKRVRATVRLGVNYENLSTVKNARLMVRCHLFPLVWHGVSGLNIRTLSSIHRRTV